MGMDDREVRSEHFPTFAFQKIQGSSSLLIPDIDALTNAFYENVFEDLVPYDTKLDKAIFVGSTTGTNHTVETVRDMQNQRLRVAMFFKNSDQVDFRLPVICQCLTLEAEEAIRDLGFGNGEQLTWDAQFRYKFLVSIDGNGATCSRVQIALKSSSVLLKFDSPNNLYYFAGLQPYSHYLPVACEQDILTYIELEKSHPHYFSKIASNGQRFFEEYLNRESASYYFSRLLSLYERTFQSKP